MTEPQPKTTRPPRCVLLLAAIASLCFLPTSLLAFDWQLRSQRETQPGSGRFHREDHAQSWVAESTAVIVCDLWDRHHCFRATKRVEELAPRIDAFLSVARQQGMTVIHAPSECMSAYENHPARLRAIAAPAAAQYPDQVQQWCEKIDGEHSDLYPIDQSDGGEDDTAEEHAAWEAVLTREQRNPQQPWLRQIDVVQIDSQRDYISDSGKEIWNILQADGIRHVILVGVHTNMCVLGRPFGLRRMKLAGKDVALVRDLTDTMYNPAQWPYVSHFTGTDLIIDYIERYISPTVSSDQLLGDKAFRFRDDARPHLAVLINEPEYETERTLPLFLREQLQANYRISFVYGSHADGNDMPGIEMISAADLLLLSVRRRTLPADQLAAVRNFIDSGKPVVGIRTANHAFCLRNEAPSQGLQDWPEFDAEVFGGSYTNHYGNDLQAELTIRQNNRRHPILQSLTPGPWIAGGSLYKVAPLNPAAEILLDGEVDGYPREPVAWTFARRNGGQSFYTSLGTPADFDHPSFQLLLAAAIQWAAGQAPITNPSP